MKTLRVIVGILVVGAMGTCGVLVYSLNVTCSDLKKQLKEVQKQAKEQRIKGSLDLVNIPTNPPPTELDLAIREQERRSAERDRENRESGASAAIRKAKADRAEREIQDREQSDIDDVNKALVKAGLPPTYHGLRPISSSDPLKDLDKANQRYEAVRDRGEEQVTLEEIRDLLKEKK
jgi:hypothetical protein